MSQVSPVAAALAGDAPAPAPPARGMFLQTPLGQDTFARYNNDDNVVQWELFQSSPLRKDRLTVHFMLDMQYRIIRATPNVNNLTGFAQDLLTAVSPHFVSFAHPKDVASMRQNLFEAASTGPAAGYIFQSRNQIAQRHRIATAFGRYTWVETVYVRSGIGEPCLLLLCSPIDPPAEDEEWMCEGELMARSFNLNIDLSRSVVWVSPACTILGFNCLQLLWVDVLDIVHPRDRERFKHAVDSLKDVIGTRISMIVDIVHGQGVYVRCSVLMESGVLMSDDQKHPWRFILANCSVLDAPMPELSAAEDTGAGRPTGFEYDASGSMYQTPPPFGTQPYYHQHQHQHQHQQPVDVAFAPDLPASQYASYTSLPDVLDTADQDVQMYNWRLIPRNLKVDPAEYENQLAQRLGNAEPHMELLDDGLLIAEEIRSICQTSPTLAHQPLCGSVSMPPSATLLGTPTSASSSTSPGTAGTGHSLLHAASADDLSGGFTGFQDSVSYSTMPPQQLPGPAVATLARRASSSSHDATGTVKVRKPKATPGHARSNSVPALVPADVVEDGLLKKDKKKSVYRPSRRRDKVCEICGRNESPEWRRGPTGHNSLCNACGIRFAKFVKSGCPPEQAIARMLRRAESDDSLVTRQQLTVADYIMSPRTDDATPHPQLGPFTPMMSPPQQQQSSA